MYKILNLMFCQNILFEFQDLYFKIYLTGWSLFLEDVILPKIYLFSYLRKVPRDNYTELTIITCSFLVNSRQVHQV